MRLKLRLEDLGQDSRSSLITTLLFDLSQPIMSAPREGPNPLRPYWIPPSVGPPSDLNNRASTSSDIGSKHASTGRANSFGSSARNILADMDYSEYIPEATPSSSALGKQLVEQALRKYTSVFLAQPFEVAKTILQVQLASGDTQLPAQARAAQQMRRLPGKYQDHEDLYGVRRATMKQYSVITFSSRHQMNQIRTLSLTLPHPHHSHIRPLVLRVPNAVTTLSTLPIDPARDHRPSYSLVRHIALKSDRPPH